MRGRFIREYFVIQRQDLLAPLFIELQSGSFWEVFDVATVVFEVGSPVLWLNDLAGFGSWLEEVDVLAILMADLVTVGAVGTYLRRRWRA